MPAAVEAAASMALSPELELCYRCKERGHRAKDCPTKQANKQAAAAATSAAPPRPPPVSASSSADVCYRCHKAAGHMAKDCPEKKRPRDDGSSHSSPFPTPSAAAPATPSTTTASTTSCYRCQATGHMAKDCPTKQQKKHKADTAALPPTPSPSSSSSFPSASNRLCYVCKSPDHISSLCPHKDDPPSRPSSSSRSAPFFKPAVRLCYRCSSPSHSTVDCPEPKPCHLCASPSHLASACPSKRELLHARTLATPKPCHLCSSLTHIARSCPTLPHRRLYRDESKPRASLACYICHSPSHHAVECEEVERLQGRFRRVEAEGVEGVGEEECNDMLDMCGRALEYKGAVWLVERMRGAGVQVTEQGWGGLVRLHEVSGKDQSRVDVEGVQKVKKARTEVGRLLKERKAGERVATAEEKQGEVEAWVRREMGGGVGGGGVGGRRKEEGKVEGGGGVLGKNLFGLCKRMREGLGWSAKECREVAMAMTHRGRFRVGKAGVEWVEEGGEGDKRKAQGREEDEEKKEGKRAAGVDGKSASAAEAADAEKERLRKAKRATEKRRKQLKRARFEQASSSKAAITNMATE